MPLKNFEKHVFSEKFLYLVKDFDCNSINNQDFEKLNKFLKCDALNYQQGNFSRTNIYTEDEICVAYYSLSMNAIKEKIEVEKEYQFLKSFPALFLTRFAVNKRYQKSGIGKAIINDIVKNTYKNNEVAARFLFVDANTKSVSWYLGNPLFTILYIELTERIEKCIEIRIIKELNNRFKDGHIIQCELDEDANIDKIKINCEKILIAHVNDIFNTIKDEISIFNECNSKVKLSFEDNKPKIKLENFNVRQNRDRIREWLKEKDNILKLDITMAL